MSGDYNFTIGEPHPDSPGEQELHLRHQQGALYGFRFNVPVLAYVVDLINRETKVIGEVDGHAHHSEPDQIYRDVNRDWDLRQRGYEVLRFTHDEVMYDTDRVIDDLEMAVVLRQIDALLRCDQLGLPADLTWVDR